MSGGAYANVTSAGVPASPLVYLQACPICKSPDARNYCRVPSLFNEGEFINYERCLDCGTVRRNPRLADDVRLDRYENEELRDEQRLIKPKNQVHYRYMLKLISSILPPEGKRRFFDFGCGSGGFLIEARAAGYDVHGLELSKGLADLVRSDHGIPVHQGLITDESFRDETFDVVVSAQVFEHLLDPVQALESVIAHMRRPGLLLIEVPNLLALKERLRRGATMDDSHLFYFTASSLSRMMRDQGLRPIAAQEGVRPWRFSAAHRLPWRMLFLAERVLALIGVRSSLSVLARLD